MSSTARTGRRLALDSPGGVLGQACAAWPVVYCANLNSCLTEHAFTHTLTGTFQPNLSLSGSVVS